MYREFTTVQSLIEKKSELEEQDQNKWSMFETKYLYAMVIGDLIIEKYNEKLFSNQNYNRLNSVSSNNSVHSGDTSSSRSLIGSPPPKHRNDAIWVTLPEVKLPTFDGKYENWCFFHDNFKSLVHDDDLLTDIVKFHYLRLSLKGEAATITQS